MWLLSQITLTGWEPFLQLGFAAFVATFLLWKHFVYAESIETNNRIHAIGDLGTQKNQQRIIELITLLIHRNNDEHDGETCKLVLEQIRQMQSDTERQIAAYDAEIRRKK